MPKRYTAHLLAFASLGLVLLSPRAARAADLSTHAPTAEIPVVYKLPRAGQVSLAIYDKQGRQLRTLLAGEPQAAGKHRLSWDGLDRAGQALPVGAYEWRLLLNDGFQSDFVTILGANAPAPPWTSWIGNHIGPSFVTTGTNGAVYVGVRFSEARPSLIKLASDQGPLVWEWGTSGDGGPIGLAEIGGDCLILNNNDYLRRYDAVTDAAQGPVIDVLWPGDKRENYGTGVKQPGFLFGGGSALRIAADGTALVIAYRDHDTLRWLGPVSGNVRRSATVKRPTALAAGANGIVYAISESNVVAVAADGTVTTVLGNGILTAPSALAYDRAHNQILVAERGTDQRIHRFAADGTPIRTYGRQGGRRDGTYVATDFLDVTDMAGDGVGGFYVLEPDGVRRIMHIRSDGSVAKQWLGGSPFNTVASADPSAPREVWYYASDTTFAKVDLDHDTGAWDLKETYTYLPGKSTFGDGLFPGLDMFPIWRVRRHAGDPNTYLIHESPAAVMRVDPAGRRLVPVALAWHKNSYGANGASTTLRAALASHGLSYTNQTSDAFTWSDTNGNGQLDPDEFRFHSEAAGMSFTFVTFDEQMNIYIGYREWPYYDFEGHGYLHFDFQGSVYAKLPNLATKPGTPLWDWSRLERSQAKVPAELRDGSQRYITKSLRCDPRGGVTLYLMGQGADRPSIGWPCDQLSSTHLLRALPDGTTQWVASKHTSPGLPRAAEIGYPAYIVGTTHGCIIFCDHQTYGGTAWTEDGLYAGYFMDRPDPKLPPGLGQGVHINDYLTPGDDWSAGGSLTDLADGSVLWFPPGIGHVSVFRVRGWDNWYRRVGTVKVPVPPTAAPAAPALTSGLVASYYRGTNFAGAPVSQATNSCLWFSSTAPAWNDKRVVDWSAGPCPGIASNEAFSVRWAGRLVAPLGEDFWFSVYNKYHSYSSSVQVWSDEAGPARLWLDGVLVINRSKGTPAGDAAEAGPFRLQAGRSYDLQIEYAFPGGTGADFSLCWASNTKESQRIPPASLRTDPGPVTPVVHLSVVDGNAAEAGRKPGIVRFGLDAPARQKLTVRYRLDGSADASDYLPLSGEVVIPAGATAADVVVKPVDDAIIEGNETARFVLRPDASYRGDGTAGTATITIADNDNRVTAGLVAYYPLDESPVAYPTPEAEGYIVHDRAGTNDAVFVLQWGGSGIPLPRWLPTGGKLGGALDFYAEPSRVKLPSLPITGALTLALWIRTTQSDVIFMTPLNGGAPVCRLEAGRWLVSGAGNVGPAGPRIDDGRWHHLAFLSDPAAHQLALYIDGNRVAQAPAPYAYGMASVYLGTGYPRANDPAFIGKVDDLRVYNRCVSADEVVTLAHLYPPCPRATGAGVEPHALVH